MPRAMPGRILQYRVLKQETAGLETLSKGLALSASIPEWLEIAAGIMTAAGRKKDADTAQARARMGAGMALPQSLDSAVAQS